MTWFTELQNRFNELKLFKILIIYVLNWVDDLTSWQKNIVLIVMQAYWLNTLNILLKSMKALVLQMLTWENIVLEVMQVHNKKRMIILKKMIKMYIMTLITKEKKMHWAL